MCSAASSAGLLFYHVSLFSISIKIFGAFDDLAFVIIIRILEIFLSKMQKKNCLATSLSFRGVDKAN